MLWVVLILFLKKCFFWYTLGAVGVHSWDFFSCISFKHIIYLDGALKLSRMWYIYFQVARATGEMCQYDGCEKRFIEVKRREEHEKSVHEGKGLKCDHCEKTFVTSAKTSLMRHMLIKHGICVKCTKCAQSFDDFNSYLTHRRQICNKQSHFKTAYRKNVERFGEPNPKFKSSKVLKTLSGESKCLLCGQITKNTNMARHIRERHNGTSANMPDKPDYNKDLIEIGAKPDPAKCNICDKKFKNVRSIPRHMKTAHGKTFD